MQGQSVTDPELAIQPPPRLTLAGVTFGVEVPGPGGVGHQDFLWGAFEHRKQVLGHCCTTGPWRPVDR